MLPKLIVFCERGNVAISAQFHPVLFRPRPMVAARKIPMVVPNQKEDSK